MIQLVEDRTMETPWSHIVSFKDEEGRPHAWECSHLVGADRTCSPCCRISYNLKNTII